MLKSLNAGVSGLRNHQMKIDVLGNNIANVNTIGFKGSRINFTESLNQTLKNAKPGNGTGYINPVQVGLGMATSSIENVFTQGALENTGVLTDLALEGEGFFILQNGDSTLFTRAGNFFFNSEGKLVNQKGLAVQGWLLPLADNAGGLGFGNTEDITIDTDYVSPANATQNVYLTGNINAGNKTVAEVWESPTAFIERAEVTGTGTAPTFPLTITADSNDEFSIVVQDNATSSIQGDITLTAGSYADMDALVSEINDQISNTSNISNRVIAVNNGGTLEFHQVNGDENTSITLQDGTNSALASIGFTDGDSDSAAIASSTTDLNDLLENTSFANQLQSGDKIDISGTNPDGSVVTSSFTYGAANDGTTLADLVSVINSSYNGVTVTFSSGVITVTDNTPGDSETTINRL